MRRVVIAGVLACLAGCMSLAAYEGPGGNVVQAGMSTEDVISLWGQPESLVDRSDSPRALIYNSHIYEYPHAVVYFVNGRVEKIMPRAGCMKRDAPVRCGAPTF